MSTNDSTFDALDEELSGTEGTDGSTSVTPFTDHQYAGSDPAAYGTRRERRIPEGPSTSDDVDPRRLVHDPTVTELRWYYRNTPFAPTVVNKPIEDAVKHGYDVRNDPTGKVEEFLAEYEPYRRRARKKARRDGFAAVLFYYEDTAAISRPPENVQGVTDFHVLTVDRLDDDLSAGRVAEAVEYDREALTVLDQGVVIVQDITHPDHGEVVGYVYERSVDEPADEVEAVFIHADRCQHFVENPEVDGPTQSHGDQTRIGEFYETDWFGLVTGHPILGPIFHQLKGLSKANWALGQTLFRYTSPLHTLLTPSGRGVDEDHIESLNEQLDDINAKSALTLPPEHEMETHGTDGEMDPEPYVNALIQMLCAGSEMTKSVLLGTQTGTVSGSSTDIKNYMNQVERYRQTTATETIHEAVEMVFQNGGQSAIPSFALGFEIEWGPLFKLDRLDAAEGMARLVQTASNGVDSYLLTPDEAREFLREEFVEFDADVDLAELEEEDFDQLDRVNTEYGKQYPEGVEPEDELEGNPRRGQNGGGGLERGETTEQANPASGST